MNSRHTRWLALVLAVCSLGGCALAPPEPDPADLPEVMITGLVMENAGQAYITAARLLVPATGQFVSCGNIAPQARCASGFPEQRYSGNPIEITWSQGANIWSTGALDLQLSEDVVEAGEALVRVIIAGPGLAGAELVASP